VGFLPGSAGRVRGMMKGQCGRGWIRGREDGRGLRGMN
jgi:hypothetical protein